MCKRIMQFEAPAFPRHLLIPRISRKYLAFAKTPD